MTILNSLDLTIPPMWSKVPLDTIANVIDPEPSHRAPALADGEGFPYIGIRDVNSDGTVNTVTARPIKEEALIEQEKRFTIENGDLIFCRVATLGNPKIIKIDKRVALSATLALIKPKKEKINNVFLLYLLDSDYIKLQTELYSTGSTRKSLGMETIRKFEVLLPPLNIQDNIARYLFKNISLLDSIVENKKNYIELLEQQRQSIITEAVTKGLNPNMKMKDSGVDWIGEIPEHWKLTKIKYVATLLNGDRGENYPSGNDFVDEGIPFITSHNLNNRYVDESNVKYISEERYNLLRGIKIKKNDIIYCLRGSVGKNALVTRDEGTIASSLMGIRASTKINAEFLSYILNFRTRKCLGIA